MVIIKTRDEVRLHGGHGVELARVDITDGGKTARVWVRAYDLGRGVTRVEVATERGERTVRQSVAPLYRAQRI